MTVRTSAEPSTIVNPLRAAIAPIVPGVPLFDVRTMEQRLGASLADGTLQHAAADAPRQRSALVLAAVGIYGVIAYFVTRRTRELGVRMALGATRADVITLVIRQALWPVGLGIAIGLAASLAATRLLTKQLFGVAPADPVTFGVVAVALALVALLASLIPALRAAGSDPTAALRM